MPQPKKQWVKPQVRQLPPEEVAKLPRGVKEKLFRQASQEGRRVA